MTSAFSFIDIFIGFIQSLNFSDWLQIGIIYLLFLWISCVIWIIRDSSMRWNGIFAQFFHVLLVVLLTPLFWLPVYFLFRPSPIELLYAESSNEDEISPGLHCHECQHSIGSDFTNCPYCGILLVKKCKSCDHMIRTNWKVCPYCADDTGENETTNSKLTKKYQKIKETT